VKESEVRTKNEDGTKRRNEMKQAAYILPERRAVIGNAFYFPAPLKMGGWGARVKRGKKTRLPNPENISKANCV